jgi:hypothetical protein
VPLLLKNLVDTMNIKATDPQALLVVPVAPAGLWPAAAHRPAVHQTA